MAGASHYSILNYLRRALAAAADNGVADADLLRRFVTERDEAAFELLMWRHAAMVLHVCRQVLSDGADAEDAFQATFLVLVRKAGSIGRREALGSWLYRVAYRTALKARSRSKKRACDDTELDDLAAPVATDDAERRELRRIVCEEVDRLSAKYRAPIVACFFEGKTHEEAAKQLGWPRGTVAGRLARAREMLRKRLTRRGVTLPAATLIGVLTARTSQAALRGLVEAGIPIFKRFAAGQSASALASPHVAALTEGVLQAMNWTRMKIILAAMLIAGAGGVGTTLWATQRKEREKPPTAPTPRIAEKPTANDGKTNGKAEAPKKDDAAAQLARNKALSRDNLKKLGFAMYKFYESSGRLPLAATKDENGKARLSWRVALLPFLDEGDLYKQFKLDEPWNSPHNKKLLSKMPAVFAPPGVKTRRPYSTFYQVFVSARASVIGRQPKMMGGMPGGQPGLPGTPGGTGRKFVPSAKAEIPGGRKFIPSMTQGGGPGGMPGVAAGATEFSGATAAFVKGETPQFPASFTDGTSNTILIIEAGNPVPWSKPEDLHYAEDEPLPELGGLFADTIHAAFVDGSIHTLKRNPDEQQMRRAITRNDGKQIDLSKIEFGKAEDALTDKDRRISQLKEEQSHLRSELKKLRAEIDALKAEVRRIQHSERKPAP